jgi:starch phosphorylase
VQAAVWKVQVGLVPVLMLDTDIPLNDPADRPITGSLYVRGREMRLCQEIVLGIGGVRALRALGIHPAVWHMNEGHVAFLALERAREGVQSGESLAEALAGVKRKTVFTTHTPVPAGNETFDRKLVKRYLEPWIRDVGCEPDEALALGADNGNFNMTAFSIRLAAATNGVSKLHGAVSSAMWRHLFPEGSSDPVGAVTNGVHTASWVGPEMRSFYKQYVDAEWEARLLEPEAWRKVHEAPDAALWAAHRSQKERLVRFVRERVRVQSARHGLSPDELRQVEGLLDPHALTIGFARRFATYKRAFLIMSDLDRLRAIVGDRNRPAHSLHSAGDRPRSGWCGLRFSILPTGSRPGSGRNRGRAGPSLCVCASLICAQSPDP